MGNNKILLLLILFCFINAPLYGEESSEKKLALDVSIEHVQKYMWRGIDLQNDAGAIQPEMVLDLWGSGFYAGTWGSFAYDDEWRIWDELDYFLGYYFTLFEQEQYAIDMDIAYTYFHFPRQERSIDTMEMAFAFKFPKLISPLGKTSFTPYTTFYYGWSQTGFGDVDGLWIKVGMDLEIMIPAFPSANEEQPLSMYIETYHNDGAQSFNSKPGWSHLAMGISTTFEWYEIGFTPGINYQWSWEDTINDEDDFWYTFGVSYSF